MYRRYGIAAALICLLMLFSGLTFAGDAETISVSLGEGIVVDKAAIEVICTITDSAADGHYGGALDITFPAGTLEYTDCELINAPDGWDVYMNVSYSEPENGKLNFWFYSDKIDTPLGGGESASFKLLFNVVGDGGGSVAVTKYLYTASDYSGKTLMNPCSAVLLKSQFEPDVNGDGAYNVLDIITLRGIDAYEARYDFDSDGALGDSDAMWLVEYLLNN